MARRGTNHSFNKRQKERKRKEKAEKKQQRRLLKKQEADEGVTPAADLMPTPGRDDREQESDPETSGS